MYCEKCKKEITLKAKIKSIGKAYREIKCDKCGAVYRTSEIKSGHYSRINGVITVVMAFVIVGFISKIIPISKGMFYLFVAIIGSVSFWILEVFVIGFLKYERVESVEREEG